MFSFLYKVWFLWNVNLVKWFKIQNIQKAMKSPPTPAPTAAIYHHFLQCCGDSLCIISLDHIFTNRSILDFLKLIFHKLPVIEFNCWKVLESQENLLALSNTGHPVRMSYYHSGRSDIPYQSCGKWPYQLLLPEMPTDGCHLSWDPLLFWPDSVLQELRGCLPSGLLPLELVVLRVGSAVEGVVWGSPTPPLGSLIP